MEKIQISAKNVNLYYGSPGAQGRLRGHHGNDSPHRAFRLQQSTFLRCINRMNDFVPSARFEGEIRIDGTDIYDGGTDVIALRRKVGMVFEAQPVPHVHL